MKQVTLLLAVAIAIASCGNNEAKEGASTTKTEKAANPEAEKGLNLITKSDCLGCHKVADKLTGPAYVDVANKYAGQDGIADTLARRIIKGSVGHWGSIPMTPHPTLSEDDAKAMVTYILTINQ
jgi:cytochrome c